MKDSTNSLSLIGSFSWAAAMALVVLWAFSLVGNWGLGVAVLCVFAPYILVVISSILTGLGFIFSRKDK